ncbi:MAG: NAD-dependent epimerase/dehydratase family protein [Chloroflexi bacterium]|nr:NAD-dependent epimerase/dehydratase family protein [Chloroflexota bacterium]
MDWKRNGILVTGGASFIGSHLVDALVLRGATVRVVDDLSSGHLENIQGHIERQHVEFIQADLHEAGVAEHAVRGMDVVFHLAADHGGRGYLEAHQASVTANLVLDGVVFRACRRAGIQKIIYASSACVYPKSKQTDAQIEAYLTEDMIGPPFDADNVYGWAKLMGEMTLRAYHRDYGIKTAVCRYFTVYGERGAENHAIIAMIARAFIRQDPFVVWGDGEQIRNWTYVRDIVEGTILAAEKIEDGSAVNLGTMERTRVIDAAREILRYTKHEARVELHPEMPTGPLNRVADNALAKKLLGWQPTVKFVDGLHRTVDWYFQTKNLEQVRSTLDRLLVER